MIPAILHQTWKSSDLPDSLRRYRDTWPARNPGLDCRFYDDAACLDLVRRDFPQYLDLYSSLPFAIQRADLFRYLAVYRFGGLYADLDMECLRPFDDFFALDGALFGVERHVTRATQARHGYREPYQIGNCIFAAEPGHPFLRAIIERVAELAAARPAATLDEVEDITGPRMLTRLFYATRPAGVRVLSQVHWLPWSFYPDLPLVNRRIFACHHFMGSWKTAAVWAKTPRARWADRDWPPDPFPAAMFHEFRGD